MSEPISNHSALPAPSAELEPFASMLQWLLLLPFAVISAVTPLTLFARFFELHFATFRLATLLVSLLVIAVVLRLAWSRARFVPASQWKAGLWLLALMAAAASLPLFLHRPDPDDIVYLPSVVACVADPATPMSFELPQIDSGAAPFTELIVGAPLPFEYIQGVLASLLGVRLLTIYYLIAPCFFGALVPIAWTYLITRFGFELRAAIFGSLILCLSLLLMTDQHRTMGNFAFARMFQAKAIMFALALPLFTGLSLDFFRLPTVRHWCVLLAFATGTVGLSTSAGMLFPMLAVLLGASATLQPAWSFRTVLRILVPYALSFGYVVIYMMWLFVVARSQLGPSSPMNHWYPQDFAGHFLFVFSLHSPLTLSFGVVSFLGAMFTVDRRVRRFLAVWTVAALTLYLNPLAADFLIHRVTTANIYWRLFYLLPFPLTVGILGAVCARHRQFPANMIPLGLLVALVVANALPGSPSLLRTVQMRPFAYRIDPSWLAFAEKIVRIAPAGTIAAPVRLSEILPVISPRHRVLMQRPHRIAYLFGTRGQPLRADRRNHATSFLELGGRGGIAALNAVLDATPEVRTVITRRLVFENYPLASLLEKRGFTEQHVLGPLVLRMKPP